MTNDTSTAVWNRPGLREAACYAAIVLLPWLVMTPALDFEFASDDRIMIVENQLMRDPGNWWRMLTTDAFDRTIVGFDYDVESLVGHYRPINKLSYLIDHTLWGPDAVGFHVTGICMHLVSGCLLLWLIRGAGVGRVVAVIGTLLFMLHPVTARAVGLISLRADLWCGLFSIAAVASAARARSPQTDAFYVASVGFTFLALLGKEAGIFLPPYFTAVAIVQHGLRREAWRPVLKQVWPYYAVVVAYMLIRFGWLHIETADFNDFPPMSVWTIFQSLSRLFFSYLLELPAPTLIDRLWLPDILTGFPPVSVWLAWAGLGGLAVLVGRVIRRQHIPMAMGLGLILLPIAPLMNVWAITGEDVGELMPFEMHRLYIPAMGYALLWTLAAARGVQSWSWRPTSVAAALGLALTLIIPMTRYPAELASYADTEAMVRRKLDFVSGFDDAELPRSLRVLRLNLRSIEQKRAGDLDGAEETLAQIQRLQPHDAIALKNLAVIALLKNEPRRAIEYLETVLKPIQQTDRSGQVRALIDDPQLRHTGEVHKLLGRAYQMTGQLSRAQEHLRLSREIDPTDLEVLLLMAFVAERRGDREISRMYLRTFLDEASPADGRREAVLRRLKPPAADR